ncbi:ChuX/HutX family heme-like substrate-binding protein [Bordetella genomosp. 10]|uniref:ChuX/HutX family heme-like substrate-binding protein n=1 Tax=Bordetella genomosp. 10 TaxID=1416804 RepID=UPI0015C6917A|nr:ChuX/HutX family heme-like substrate-binding protein [Bordetella genomosp. 10]
MFLRLVPPHGAIKLAGHLLTCTLAAALPALAIGQDIASVDRWTDIQQRIRTACDDACRQQPLKAQWETLRALKPALNARDAARVLHVSEVELLATEIGPDVVPLRTDPAALKQIWARLDTLGPVIAVTRNENGISERTSPGAQAPVALAPHWAGWGYVFAVTHYSGKDHKPVRSLQAYDLHGDSITKIILNAPDGDAAFDRMAREYRDVHAFQPPAQLPRTRSDAIRPPAAQGALAWKNIHDHATLERAFEVGDASTDVDDHAGFIVRDLDISVFDAFVTALVERHVRVTAVVGNRGLSQLYTGNIERAHELGQGFFSLAGPGVELHIYRPALARARLFRSADHRYEVVEFMDGAGVAIRFLDGTDDTSHDSGAWQAALKNAFKTANVTSM